MLLDALNMGAASIERDHEFRPDVIRKVMGDGTPRVRKAGPTQQFLTARWDRLTVTDWGDLSDYLETNGWGASNITLVDDYGASFTVRYWDGSLKGRRRLGRFYSATARFMVVS